MNIQKIVTDPNLLFSPGFILVGIYYFKKWKRQRVMNPNPTPWQQVMIFYALLTALAGIIGGVGSAIILVLEDGWGIYGT